MAKLITAQELTHWASSAGQGTKYLLVRPGTMLTPGALDAARNLGIQVLYRGQGARTVLQRLAEEVTGGTVATEDLVKLEARVMAKLEQ